MVRNKTLVVSTVSIVFVLCMTAGCASQSQQIRYGISPYQDTAMPVVAQSMDLYRKNGLNVELVNVAWEDIIPSLASHGRTIDVGIGSINLLLPRAENINAQGGGDVIFYYPLYVFKGAALMVSKESGVRPLSEFLAKYPNDRNRAIKEAVQQIVGMTVGVPQGTPYEEMLMYAFKTAGEDYRKEVKLTYVNLQDALPAFLGGHLQVSGAGVTQRTEAQRHGARVFMQMEDINFAEIIGLVTTQHYAAAHSSELDKLERIWFESVDYLMNDVDHRAAPVLSYLAKTASTKYSLDEYKQALGFQLFPRSEQEARQLFLDPAGRFYWKTWGPAGEEIVTAALCLSSIGLKSYGEVYLTLSERFFAYRSVVLEENSYDFVTRHAIKKPFDGPRGYLATWADRHMLAVAKHASDLTIGMNEAGFAALVLKSDAMRENDEFLEIAIYGGFNIKSVESIAGDPKLTSVEEPKNEVELLRKLRWRVLYQKWEQQKT